ncbi:MAG TPA: FAD-binding and (Fe-S)-binding domain-containing protein [Solirubrobacteraceae bacterium]|nr:FAD-binding and (Fe-S)-binding domain-containing protein [Solirubrobacteraceae bacterium]
MAAPAPAASPFAPPAAEPTPDRAPDWVAGGTPRALRAALEGALGADQVAARALDLVRYASDASPYRLIPQAVAIPRDVAGVVSVLRVARETGTPLVWRAGGTSLSGQAQTDGILVDVRRHFRGVRVEDGGERVRVEPGVVLGDVNRRLARHGRRLEPDPASTDIACVGGVIANNSGGMRCGVHADSYRTLRSMTFVLADGTVIDTAAPGAAEEFERAAPALARGLIEIRDELRADAELSARVARKFEIKNTTGLRLCAFLDADEPLEIFRRLIVGSEGTLAFVAEATFETVALRPSTSLALAHFEDIDAAVELVPELVAAGATATELMVAPTLIAAAWNMHGTPPEWKELPPASAALLVELRADDPAELDAPEREALSILGRGRLVGEPSFSRERERVEMLWRVREGMQGLLAAMRAPGVTMIIEDVCVPPARIGECAKDLQALLGAHGFLPGVAGHASAGNLHFLLTPNFGEPADLERYEAFMGELVELIVRKYDGSLKAEHGTGINMAPYVEREWGGKATEMMWRVRRLADPAGVFAPGVLLTDREGAHLQNLKSAPAIEAVATQCIECGFCEPVCPSRDLTTTPRQRIALRREMARQLPGSPVLEALLADYGYDAVQTCAADGSCALACPVGIDTGKLVKELRARTHDPRAERVALTAARNWRFIERGARAALRVGLAGEGEPMRALTGLLRTAVSHELLPQWSTAMPAPAPPLPATGERAGAAAVYFPACVNRIFGNAREHDDSLGLPEALVAVSRRAGLPLWIPPDVQGSCCATPWSSKGFADGHTHMAARTARSILEWTDGGRLPLVVDATSCTLGLLREAPDALDEAISARFAEVRVLDSIEWVHDSLLPRLEVSERVHSIAVHPPCAAVALGLSEKLRAIAGALAEDAHVPASSSCCGTAGDRGLLHPELPAAALAGVAEELSGRAFNACVCSNRTCEIGLSEATGRPYESFVLLLEQLTRPGA